MICSMSSAGSGGSVLLRQEAANSASMLTKSRRVNRRNERSESVAWLKRLLYLDMSRIRTFAFPEAPETAPLQATPAGPAPDADEDVAEPLPSPPLTLALSRKDSSYILVHPAPMSASAPNERQYAIINALVQADPFPELGEGGRSRLWLKIGAGKSGEVGGENEGLLEKLVAAGVVKE